VLSAASLTGACTIRGDEFRCVQSILRVAQVQRLFLPNVSGLDSPASGVGCLAIRRMKNSAEMVLKKKKQGAAPC